MPEEPAILFFDGVCNLCNRSVQLVLLRDKKNVFKFASLQSDFAGIFFEQHHYTVKSDSIILYYKGHFYERTDALWRIAQHLSFPYPLFAAARILPKFIRDAVYKWIAARRYRWFGKRESCMVPQPQWAQRFLS